MLEKIKQFLEFSAKNGLYLPLAYDGDREVPSVTLLFAYTSFVMCLLSIGYTFINNGAITPVVSSIMLFIISITMYRIRRLDSVEVDLDDKSIKIKSDTTNNESENKNAN